MLLRKLSALLVVSMLVFACDDDTKEVEIDTSMPQGEFTATASGMFVATENAPNSAGTVEIGTDAEGNHFMRFGDDFNTALATGTVTVWFSTSEEFVPDPMNGNPDLLIVGPVTDAGENYFKLDGALGSKFTHVILWCGSVGVKFGHAELN